MIRSHKKLSKLIIISLSFIALNPLLVQNVEAFNRSNSNLCSESKENQNSQLVSNKTFTVPWEVARVYELTNIERAKYNLPPLKFNYNLYVAAQRYSQSMDRLNCYSHNCGGSDLGDRAWQAGYPYLYVGENIDIGYRSPEETVRRWMDSPGHRQNILNPNYTEFGAGYYNGYWTQVFGSRQ